MAIILRHAKHLLSVKLGREVTWEDVEKHFGLHERHRKYLTNTPGYKSSPSTKLKIMVKYLALLEPPPLPDFALLWRDKLMELKAKPGGDPLKDHLERWTALFNHPSLSGDPVTVIVLGYCNLLSHITMALQAGKSKDWFDIPQSLEKAEQLAETTKNQLAALNLSALPDGAKKTITWLRPIVFLNWVQVILEREKRGLSPERARKHVIALLKKNKVLTVIRDALQTNPFFWQLVYNALEIACVLEDKDAAWEFYEKLVELDPGFKSLSYTPGEVIPIKDEPNMEFFRKLYAEKHAQKRQPQKTTDQPKETLP
ncbi:hypothetical protein ACTGJ9_006125 [Bradyrhizobium sp. RDM12]